MARNAGIERNFPPGLCTINLKDNKEARKRRCLLTQRVARLFYAFATPRGVSAGISDGSCHCFS